MITTESSKETYVGNGSASTFGINFRVLNRSHLLVTITPTPPALGSPRVLVENTDYTLSNTGAYTGWQLHLIEPVINYGDPKVLATGETLTIERVPPFTQGTDLRDTGTFSAEAIENALDYGVMLAQRAKSLVDDIGDRVAALVTQTMQVFRLSGATSGQVDLITDAAAGDTVAKFPGTGASEVVAYQGFIADTTTPTAGAGAMGFNSSLDYPSNTTGATLVSTSPRALNLWRWMTPAERAALVAKTIPDLTTAIQTAINECPIGYDLVFPSGPFKTTSVVTVGKAIRLIGAGTYGSESGFNDHSQWTIPDSGIAIQIDPAFVGGGIAPISQYAAGAWFSRISGFKFQGLAGASIAARIPLNQICINIHDGWMAEIDHCDFRNIGTCFGVNGCWAVSIHDNLFLDNGYAVRQDPDFALAGYRDGATKLYQLNNLVFYRNAIVTSGYGLYFYGPFHQVSVSDNVIQGCTQIGIMAASYNGSLATAGTDLANKGDALSVRDNYIEDNAVGIQLGKIGTGSIASSAPFSVVIDGNFNSFQNAQIYCLKVIAAVDSVYKNNRTEKYATATPDIIFDANCYVQRCEFESLTGWSGDLNGDTTSTIRRFDSTYRSWTTFYIDNASASKVSINKVATYNAGTATAPFDSFSSFHRFLRTVLWPESHRAQTDMSFITINVLNGTYAETIGFDFAKPANAITIQPDASATADGITISGISHNNPQLYLNVSGSSKIVFNVDPSAANPMKAAQGAVLRVANVKLKYASAGAAGSKGFFADSGSRIMVSFVSNFDANKPETGLYASGGTIMKDGTVPTGATTNETANKGGVIR